MKSLLAVFVLAAVLTGCSTTSGTFSDVTGKEWRLIEVRIESEFRREVLFDRKMLANQNARNVFNLKFDATSLAGEAAPNRYNAPYTLGEGNAITIMPMRSTQMAAVWQPERLREHDYFQYMQNVYRWELRDGRLTLFSKNAEDQEIRLLFN